MARLSMHMLDTVRGEGAAGIRVDFSKLEGGSYKLVRTITTNEAGRTAEPLMTGDLIETGSHRTARPRQDGCHRLERNVALKTMRRTNINNLGLAGNKRF